MDNSHRHRCRAICLAGPIFWAGIILWLSLSPVPPSPPSFLSWDKLQHTAAYALLTLLTGPAVVPLFRSRRSGWFCAALAAVVFGALVELAQGTLSAVRTAEAGDLLANAAGAAAAFFAVQLTGRARKLP